MARRKRRHEEHVNHERWLVSYADFITLLFAFFTTLYAISTVDQSKAGKLMYSMRTAFNLDFFKGNPNNATQIVKILENVATGSTPGTLTQAPGGGDAIGELSKKFGELAGDPTLKGKIQVRREQRGLVISLAEAGFFGSGSAALRPEAVDALMRIASNLQDENMHVTVEGHTDNVPIKGGRYGSNWELSTARASLVVSLFIDQGKVDARRVTAAGYGEHKPVAANDTAEGRARNRRVDIVVSPALLERVATDGIDDAPADAAPPAAPTASAPPAPNP